MANYVIEYKNRYDYGYRFLLKPNGDYVTFKSLADARKKCIKLISDHTATLCVIRGGVEKLVYITDFGRFVYENRDTGKWNMLNKDGSLGKQVDSHAIWPSLIKS